MRFLKIVNTFVFDFLNSGNFPKINHSRCQGEGRDLPGMENIVEKWCFSEGSICCSNISKNSLQFDFSIESLAKIFKYLTKFLGNLCISTNPAVVSET